MANTTFDDLTPRERWRVWWAFIWRGLVITVCSTLAGAVAGFAIGFIVAFAGAAHGHDARDPGVQRLIRVLAGTTGCVIGLVLGWQYVRWLFCASLGGFRLALVRESSDATV